MLGCHHVAESTTPPESFWRTVWIADVAHGGRIVFRRYRHRLRRDGARSVPPSAGQALVEMALIATVLLTLFASAFDLGRVFYAHITVSNAARAGALQASITPNAFKAQDCAANTWDATNAVICAIEHETAGSLTSISSGQITVSCVTAGGAAATCSATPQAGIRSKVAITTTFAPITPFISAIVGSNVAVSSAAFADQVALPSPLP
jgi:Flp pilus assembly protein TadG